MTKQNRFSLEVRQRAARIVLGNQDTDNLQWAAISAIALKLSSPSRHCVCEYISRNQLMISRMRWLQANASICKNWSGKSGVAPQQWNSTSGVNVFCPSGDDPLAMLDNSTGCWADHAEMCVLAVQQSPVNGTYRIYLASGGRKSVLRFTEWSGCGNLNTQAKYYPRLPSWFTPIEQNHLRGSPWAIIPNGVINQTIC